MFRLHTDSLHQAMRSTGYVKPYKALCSTVVGWFSTAVIGAFRSSLFRWVVLSVDRFIFSKPCRTNVCWKCERQKVAQFWRSRYRDTESALIQVWRNASVLLHQRDPWGSHAKITANTPAAKELMQKSWLAHCQGKSCCCMPRYCVGMKNIHHTINYQVTKIFNWLVERVTKAQSKRRKSLIMIRCPFLIRIVMYQLTKLWMLEFYYDFLDCYISHCDFELIQMDTDSNYIVISVPLAVHPELNLRQQSISGWHGTSDTGAVQTWMRRHPDDCAMFEVILRWWTR